MFRRALPAFTEVKDNDPLRPYGMTSEGIIRRVNGLVWAGVYLLELLSLFYVVSLPVACLFDKTRVPGALRPLGHLLETPVRGAMEGYLRLWHVDPDMVRCALYEP